MPDGILKLYRTMIAESRLTPDPAQALAAEKLQLLANRLARRPPQPSADFFSFFGRLRKAPAPIEGVYLFGAVGRGKTMLMDLFYESVAFKPRRRLHFHEFMAEVHDAVARLRKLRDGDPLPVVAQIIAAEAQLLCLDELQVTDIADAMILGRLFSGLFAENVTVVATSNVAPRDLYKDGLNRALFVPFIGMIEQRMEPLELVAARDYRLQRLDGMARYFAPLNGAARNGVQTAWERLTGQQRGEAAETLEQTVKGRTLTVPEAAMGVARFGFADLCGRPLGANDYLAIAHHFHTVVVEDIPVLRPERRDEARRFVTLIDALYNAGITLIASAEDEPDALYRAGDGAVLFQRTVSRLMEMRSDSYPPGRDPDPARPRGP